MTTFLIIFLLVWFVSFIFSAFGYAVNGIDCTPLAFISTLIPLLNTFLLVYLWYKQIVKTSGFKNAVRDLVDDLRNL